MKRFYNINQAIYIEVNDITPSSYYKYKTGTWLRPEGIYTLMDNYININDIQHLPGLLLKDNIVYTKPEVEVFFSKHIIKKYYFDTYEQALEKAEELKKLTGIWI